MDHAIRLQDVHLALRDRPVLAGVSLVVAPGEILALMGPSGSGKTTLLRVILGLSAPARGRVWVGGVLTSENARTLRPPEERNLAVVFQDLALWPHMTVGGNLSFALEARRVPAPERRERVATMLERVGMAGSARRYPGELSGGERQRVAIARALVLDPVAVLLDEPLANLDAGLKRELLAFFRGLLEERGTAAVFVTHDPREAARLGDRLAVIASGSLVQQGPFAEVSARPVCPAVEQVLAEF